AGRATEEASPRIADLEEEPFESIGQSRITPEITFGFPGWIFAPAPDTSRQMEIIRKSAFAALALISFAATSAFAQNAAPDATAAAAAATPAPVGSFKSWSAYTFEDNGRLMCYAQSAPKDTIGEVASRGSAAVMVIQAPDATAKDQVSIVLGFLP